MKRLTVDDTKKAVSRVTAPIREIERKVNPLEQKVDTHETADSGTESLKLANQAVKTADKTVKTTKSAVKTTKNAVKKAPQTIKKTAKATKEVAKATAKVAKATAKATAKVVQVTVKVAAKVITELVAALSNPYVLLAVAIVVVVVLIIYGLVILLGGGDTNQKAMTQAIGLGNVEEQYDYGKDFYNTALENRKNELSDIMNSLDYDKDDREKSDLLYYKRFDPTQIIYEKDFPTDIRKQNIMNTWEHQFDESQAVDFIAIAYVYLEKQKNDENNTQLNIYKVEFTQEVFDELIEKCIKFVDTVNQNQECPNADCTRDRDAYKAWNEMDAKLDKALNGLDEWREPNEGILKVIRGCDNKEDILDYVEWRVEDYWKDWYGDIYTEDISIESYSDAVDYYNNHVVETYNSILYETSELWDIYESSKVCYHEHELHSLGVSFLNAEQLMDALGFDETEKQWAELTSYGFKEMGVDDEN